MNTKSKPKSIKKITKKTKKSTALNQKQSKQQDMQEQVAISSKPNNEERFYCKNANLLREMLKWKNSTKLGLPVYKMINGRLVKTKNDVNGDYLHEKYEENTKYYIKFPKTNPRYELLKQKNLLDNISLRGKMFVEDVTEIVKHQGYAFDIDDNERNRTIPEALGIMMTQIAEKVSNHSFFRNYNQWDKSDMQAYAYEKIIRGLPNYSFRFTNVFAYFTQACFNSFKSILSKHYKQINIKRDLVKRAMADLQTDVPGSSMEKCLRNQFKNNDYDDFSEF